MQHQQQTTFLSKENQIKNEPNFQRQQSPIKSNIQSKENDENSSKPFIVTGQKKLNQSQIQCLTNLNPIEVFPSEIHFKNIQINQTYEVILKVRNLTKKVRRIRVFQPTTPYFKADYDLQGPLTAGLAIKITITFETTPPGNYIDTLKIVSEEGFCKEIPLYANMPQAQLIFEPFINLGFVKVQEKKKDKIYFKNEGSIAAKVELKSSDPQDLQIEVNQFMVQPNQEYAAGISFDSPDAGLFKGFISVKTDAQCLQKQVDVTATCVEFSKFIIDNKGNQCTQFDFGTFYFGEERKIEGFLVNNTPNKFNFKSLFRFGLLFSADDITSFQTPNEVGKEQTEKIMSVSPSEGVIESYSKIKLIFTCKSNVALKNQFWAQSYSLQKEDLLPELEDYSYSALFCYEDSKEQPTILHITGRGICPTVKLQKSLIQFGDCSVNAYRDFKFGIENKNNNIPIKICFDKIPYFEISPNNQVIQANSKQFFNARFFPKAVGTFEKNMQIFLINKQYVLSVKMIGKALDIAKKEILKRGIESLPEDFQILDKATTLVDSDNDAKQPPPIDFAYEVGMIENRIDSPQLQLPVVDEPLYVNKPIGNYIPFKNEELEKTFNPDANLGIKKKWHEQPVNHKETREVNQLLEGESLKKIFAGPIHINFGQVYIKSTIIKHFTVRNDLRKAISVRLIVDSDDLAGTYQKMQIVPPSQDAGFEIVLKSFKLGQFRSNVKYIINEKHTFELQVLAEIQVVRLELSKSFVKMQFFDDNHEMFTKETIKLTNNGNAPGKFEWFHTPNKIFTVVPEKGEVPAYSNINLNQQHLQEQQVADKALYNPTNRIEEEKLTLRTFDGLDFQLKCQGIIQEAKCQIQKFNQLDLKQVCVSKTVLRTFFIKNQSKMQAVFAIDEQTTPECVTLSPVKGRIGPDESKEITVTFLCKEEKEIKGEISVLIRGGKILKAPFYAEVIIPQVMIQEEYFDFGNLTTLGNQGIQKMLLVNRSDIPADLILDMRTNQELQGAQEGVECLEVQVDGEDEESILNSVHEEEHQQQEDDKKDNSKNKEIDEEEEEDDIERSINQSSYNSLDSIEAKNNKNKNKLYKLTIFPQSKINFLLKFCPKQIQKYDFYLPLTLSRYGSISSLERRILCKGLHPKFLIDPQICEFKRKIITTPDKCFASSMQIALNNPSRMPMKWKIDTSSLSIDNVFNIIPSNGIVEGNSQVVIDALFNPYTPDKYQKSVPLYILEDDEISEEVPYVEISLKGEAAFPRLVFDRKEIILPAVPLDVQSKCIFRIVNDGYENLNLKYKIIQDIQPINVTINWIEGKNLGITKHRIKVEALFSSKKPLSFTTRVEFIDDLDRIYSINISGTSDNSIFTNYSYFQRNPEAKQQLQVAPEGFIFLKDIENINEESFNHEINRRNMGVPSVASNKSFGFQSIAMGLLDKTIDHIKRWLNYQVLQQPIVHFPQSVIQSHGSQIFELMTFLTGKQNFPFKYQSDQMIKRVERIKKVMHQYECLIQQLKIEGAMLNHIRPEFLLVYTDYLIYVKMLPQQQTQLISQNALRMSNQKFTYLQIDSWITLFYQILKIYFLGRLVPKTFKQLPGIPTEKLNLPPCIDKSNVFSQAEQLVLYWIEIHTEIANPLIRKKLCNIEQDLQDCVFFQYLIQSHVGKSTSKMFQNIKRDCQNQQDQEQNAEKILEVAKNTGINTYFEVQDFTKGQMRELILFNLQMIYILPNYIPKENPIIFSCILGEEIVRTITLSNPTQRTIWYQVRLVGHSDFQLNSEDIFMIEPKKEYSFRVKFVSRVSDMVTARIFFTNRKESNVQTAAIVFDLQSQIKGRISEKIIHINSNLYECNDRHQIQVTNKSITQDGEYEVQIIHIKPEIQHENNSKTKRNPQFKNSNKIQTHDEEIFPSFFCRQYNTQKLRIKKNSSANINILFIPLIMQTQRCYLIFKDPNIGEFQYEIIGTVDSPLMYPEIIKLPLNSQPIYIETTTNIEIQLNVQNEAQKRARKQIEQLMLEKNKEKYQKGDKYALKNIDKINFPGTNLEQQGQFQVEIQPAVSFITIPQSFTIPNIILNQVALIQTNTSSNNNNNTRGSIVKESQNLENTVIDNNNIFGLVRFPLSFYFKNPVKDYKLELTLHNKAKTDIRKYRLEVTSNPKPIKAILEFKIPARQTSTQEIPIINDSEKDWTIKVLFFREPRFINNHLFQASANFSKEFVVKKKSQTNFLLYFKPKWICEAECKLQLQNIITNDLYEYTLKGKGLEPLAENHIVLKCISRQSQIHEIQVQNPYTDKDVTYQVETDLINAQGPPSLKIKAGAKASYNISVTPVLSGQYTGSITFQEQEGIYQWFTVTLNTVGPAAEKVIDIQTSIRQSCATDIEILNPLPHSVVFDVIINGVGLVGNQVFQIESNQAKIYTLLYSPLQAGKNKGSIAFINSILGEKWFDLNLQCDEFQQVKVPILKTELGKNSQYVIKLENPIDKKVKVITKCSNSQNFEVFPQDIVLKPLQQTDIYIKYSPSTLDIIEQAEITFLTSEIGKWSYYFSGTGIPPNKYETRQIHVNINKDYSSSIQFKNPLKESIQIQIYMRAQAESKKVFKMLLKGKKVKEEKIQTQIEALQALNIPFSFIPNEIAKYYCEIVVAMNEKIEWIYPIEGITQLNQQTIIQSFKCKCRESLDEEFSLKLDGINDNLNQNDIFSFELKGIEEHLKTIIEKSINIKISKNQIANANDKLEFQLKFTPLKPFQTTIEFHVLRKTGGKWRYFMSFEATEPEFDDTIIISSSLNKTQSVSFKLTNKSKQFASFTASFTSESDTEFTVFPKSGNLESYGRDGTNFIVSFTPIQYGGTRTAKLIIQTEEMYWSYLVKGKLPKYDPPQPEQSLINDKLEAHLDLRSQGQSNKNYMQNNIKKAKKNNQSKKSFTNYDSNNSTRAQIVNNSQSISYIGGGAEKQENVKNMKNND
ncbi:hypothetical protein IMG5_121460 [Ichthyophthirius multifiliis]|uniref:Uncharacterized protein n=1 Tax=Ichthyophthirius multifiliis TaxID=5932 RepID=G0QV59_ICHMU|nr:hypothetical protein IMG5_121460 [Ichthyophthirius multifiliis]EGR30900.1 hypothetical protein IMG5_121460 [Ichthyophthirius multifiliis]|eukprot:XP_004032487.1 hypothetical protein IMG5_121460 [Ichthyophthirius multifiliis]